MIKNPIKEGVAEIKKWLAAYLEVIKMKAMRKGVEIASRLSFILVLILFGAMGLLFLGIALAFFVGSLVNSIALGFLIVGAIPLLFLSVLLATKKRVILFLLNLFTRLFF